ncbi:hypothetical protein HYX17_05275 [Candidatus Woesearchaeota archaeon]|nr:hypothetical protein [Candidatus Woesearchaeota archaeon]
MDTFEKEIFRGRGAKIYLPYNYLPTVKNTKCLLVMGYFMDNFPSVSIYSPYANPGTSKMIKGKPSLGMVETVRENSRGIYFRLHNIFLEHLGYPEKIGMSFNPLLLEEILIMSEENLQKFLSKKDNNPELRRREIKSLF